MTPLALLEPRVRELLLRNRVHTSSGRYTRPAHRTYPHQWLWDSCFHAVLHHALGDVDAARDELRALFRAQELQGMDRGRLPHMTFLGGSADEAAQDAGAREQFQRDAALWHSDRASSISQPPIVAETALRIGDGAFWAELWGPLSAYYDWWLRRRDPDGDDLVAIWHLWECGADATPRGDAACQKLLATGRAPASMERGTVNPTARKSPELLRARFLMLEALQQIDGDELSGHLDEARAQRLREELLGHEAVDMQAYLVKNLVDLASIGDALGKGDESARYRAAARRIARAVNDKLWDDEAGFYFDRWGSPEQVVRVFTPAPLVALYAGDLVPRDRAERLLAHLLHRESFWTRWPVPTVARDADSFDADEYWRGSTWVNLNWFIVQGLISSSRRFGDRRWLEPARTIAERTVDLVLRFGFREYYRSGGSSAAADEGVEAAAFGPEGFGWSALALDLARMLEDELAGVRGC